MESQIHWENAAVKKLLKIDLKHRQRINEAVKALATPDREHLDIKKLISNSDNAYRLRVGSYRVIYKLINSVPRVINVIDVNSREGSYKKKK